VLPDRQRSGGLDCSLHIAVDEQLVQKFDRAFDRNSSGEKSAGLRWHGRAVEWSRDDRRVWLIRLREFNALGKRLHGENRAGSFGIQEAESFSERQCRKAARTLGAVIKLQLTLTSTRSFR
jgi:hypothetical protein